MSRGHDQTRLDIIPITLPVANSYISRWHRHHAPFVTVHGGTERLNKGFVWFCIAAIANTEIVGVAVVGRPTNRNNDDGQTLEVLRVATAGHPNTCSCLYGACARAAKAMGSAQIITYTLDTEPGTSLRAAGWDDGGGGIKSCWTAGKGKARPGSSGSTVTREHLGVAKRRWKKSLREPIEVVISRDGLPDYSRDWRDRGEQTSLLEFSS